MNLRSYLRGAGLGMIITAVVLMASSGNKSHAMTDEEIKAKARELGMTEESGVLLSSSASEEAPAPTEAVDPLPSETEEIIEPEVVSADEVISEDSLPADTLPADILPEDTEKETDTVSDENLPSDVTADAGPVIAPDEGNAEASDTDSEVKDEQTTSLKSDLTGEDKKKSELMADAVETEEEDASDPVKTDSGFVSIHVSSGLSSTAVARALKDAGAIDDAGAFDRFLCANGYDRHISTGEFRIPAGSSDEEIAKILMRR